MSIHRVIFRFDFKANFEIVDRPGEIMRILDDVSDGFWDELREASQNRRIMAVYKKAERERVARFIAVEPTAIYGVMESMAGWPLEDLEANRVESFRVLLRLVTKLFERFQITDLSRAGLRLIHLGTPLDRIERLRSVFRQKVATEVSSHIEKNLGEIADFGFGFEGMNEDKIHYRVSFGPYLDQESQKWFQEFGADFTAEGDPNLIFDLDLFEHDISLPSGSAARWMRPLFARAKASLHSIEAYIGGAVHESGRV
ncbi:MAG: hypothetical protein LPK58_05585 [Gammaproteobacteria bacterium]|nr:hypothetical protein [Gammaproteobacteria bacterium]MDX5375113.1 hypothetical protein [Gammaproteobacteria bacterium]